MVARKCGVDAALEADLDGAALPRLARAAHDLLERDEVGRAAEVGGELALGEGAEAAAEVTDVRVVDVARDDVGDGVAADLAAQVVGGAENGPQVGSARLEELRHLVLVERLLAHLGEDRRQLRIHAGPSTVRYSRRRGRHGAGGPAIFPS